MQEIQYIGERLWIGEFGHLSVITGFVFSILAAFSYFKAEQTKESACNVKKQQQLMMLHKRLIKNKNKLFVYIYASSLEKS